MKRQTFEVDPETLEAGPSVVSWDPAGLLLAAAGSQVGDHQSLPECCVEPARGNVHPPEL